MKSLSVRNPFAREIAAGVKTIEVRSRQTGHRGQLLICATKNPEPGTDRDSLTDGRALCVVEVLDCRPFEPSDERAARTPYVAGQHAWVLRLVTRIDEPFPVSGRLGFFETFVQGEFQPAEPAGESRVAS